MPLKGILNTAHALSFYTRRQEVQANNLANASSDGFKADRVLGHATAGSTFPVPVQATDLQQGAFRETERPLDLGRETLGRDRLVVDSNDFPLLRTYHGFTPSALAIAARSSIAKQA